MEAYIPKTNFVEKCQFTGGKSPIHIGWDVGIGIEPDWKL